jgi:MFS family permease
MVATFRAALAGIFRLLRVRPGEDELGEMDERARQVFPSNFAAIAVNGFFFPTAGQIVAAGLLLTWFVSELTESALWVGIIIPIQYGLSLIAQPWVAEWLSSKRRRHRYYTYQALLRGLVWIVLALASLALGGDTPVLLLVIFYAVIVVDAVAAGVGNIAFSDTLARVIPRTLRGRVRGWRGVFGGMTTAAVGLLIRTSFSEESGIRAYALLFGAAGLLYSLGGLVFGSIDAPEAQNAHTKPRLSDMIGRIQELWGDPSFRRFVIAESLLIPLVQGLPFFVLFAKQTYNLEIDALGPLIIVSAITPILANFAWGRLADRFGNRTILVAAAVAGLIAPVCAFLLYNAGDDSGSVMVLLGVIVFAVGVASNGIDLTTKNYILELAPDDEARPFYIGVNDTLVGLPTMLLAATGLIVDLFGFVPVFIGIATLAVGGILVAARLPTAHKQAQAVNV